MIRFTIPKRESTIYPPLIISLMFLLFGIFVLIFSGGNVIFVSVLIMSGYGTLMSLITILQRKL